MSVTQENALSLQMKGYRLSTAEIIYHMPDHPGVLQTFVWQYYDIAPDYPEIHKFLDFWQKNIDGPLYSVKVGQVDVISPGESCFADALYTLH